MPLGYPSRREQRWSIVGLVVVLIAIFVMLKERWVARQRKN